MSIIYNIYGKFSQFHFRVNLISTIKKTNFEVLNSQFNSQKVDFILISYFQHHFSSSSEAIDSEYEALRGTDNKKT